MTAEPLDRLPGAVEVASCCNLVYGHPLAEALVGESFHPGGLKATRELLAVAALAPGARILDVGCGLGASARLAAREFGLVVEALDVSEEVLQQARARSTDVAISWRQGDAAALPQATGTYDAVLAECVLAACPREPSMAEIRRVLRPGGLLLLSDVLVSGEPIEHLEAGDTLATALCVASAWLPGELDERIEAEGLQARRYRDRSGDVLRLIDRVEGRLTIARDLLSDVPDRRVVEEVTRSLRGAVADGRLGYFAAIAQA